MRTIVVSEGGGLPAGVAGQRGARGACGADGTTRAPGLGSSLVGFPGAGGLFSSSE